MSSPANVQIKSTASPAPANLSAVTSAPETPLSTTESATTPNLPPASVFTFLPDLYVLISRLSELRNPPQLSSSQDTTANNTQDNGNLTQTVSRESNASLRLLSSSEKTIEIKDLPGHVFGLKRRIADARTVVAGLEDGSRTVKEQEAEMKVLRGRIAGCRKRLGELGAISARSATADVTMKGLE